MGGGGVAGAATPVMTSQTRKNSVIATRLPMRCAVKAVAPAIAIRASFSAMRLAQIGSFRAIITLADGPNALSIICPGRVVAGRLFELKVTTTG